MDRTIATSISLEDFCPDNCECFDIEPICNHYYADGKLAEYEVIITCKNIELCRNLYNNLNKEGESHD